MKRNPIEIFSEWADLDKDFGMEKNHKASVDEMLANVSEYKTPYTFIAVSYTHQTLPTKA